MLHIQLLAWSKKPIMTSSNDKSTNKQSKSQKHQLWQPKFTQAQVPVHIYADTSFVFILTHDGFNTRRSKHFVTLGIVYGSTSLHRLRGLSQRMLERQVLRWIPLPMVPGVGRSVLVHARTEGIVSHNASRLLDVSIKFWVNSCSCSSGCCHLVSSDLCEQMHSANVT